MSTARSQAAWTIDLVHRGLKLRGRGLSYSSIAVVLNEYHGLEVTEEGVRSQLRAHGAVPRPRGVGIGSLRRTAAA